MDPTTDRAAEQAAVPTRTFHAVVTRCERWADKTVAVANSYGNREWASTNMPQYRHTFSAGTDCEINATLDAPLAIDTPVDVTIGPAPTLRRSVLAGTALDTCTEGEW